MQRDRRNSLPEIWGVPPEHCVDFHVDRLHYKIESLELEVKSLTRQLADVLRLLQRNQEGDVSKILSREISLPIFTGEIVDNANEFLCDIGQYLQIKKIPEIYQAKIIGNALKGRAKVWFDAVRYELNNFNEFCERFRAEFLSEEAQERARDYWRANRYVTGNLLKYFYARVGEASRFVPPLSEYQRNKEIVKQFPNDIRIALASTDLHRTEHVIRALVRIDEACEKQDFAQVNKGLEGRYSSRVNVYDFEPRQYARQNHAPRENIMPRAPYESRVDKQVPRTDLLSNNSHRYNNFRAGRQNGDRIFNKSNDRFNNEKATRQTNFNKNNINTVANINLDNNRNNFDIIVEAEVHREIDNANTDMVNSEN